MQSKSYSCTFPNCNKSYPKPSLLQLHTNTHTQTRPYKCTLCPKSYFKRSHLSVHEIKHTGIKNFQCNACKTFFYTKDKLTVHMKVCGIKYTCEICEKEFVKRACYLRHLETHENDAEKELLKKRNEEKKKLIIQKKKERSKKFECIHCEKKFMKSYNVEKHIKTVHLKVREFFCECGKSYLHKHNLEKHIETCNK